MDRHTFLLSEGYWKATGTFQDDQGAEYPLNGETVIKHLGDRWVNKGVTRILAERSVNFNNDYDIEPLAPGAMETHWSSQNPALGPLYGTTGLRTMSWSRNTGQRKTITEAANVLLIWMTITIRWKVCYTKGGKRYPPGPWYCGASTARSPATGTNGEPPARLAAVGFRSRRCSTNEYHPAVPCRHLWRFSRPA